MPEVLEIEQTETELTAEVIKPQWNSWVIELPEEIVEAQNLPQGTLVTMTYRNGRIEGSIITPSPELKAVSQSLLEKNHSLYGELKRIGD